MTEGIIFDLDGVISDTQKIHSKTESELLARHGIKIAPEEITEKYAGVKTREFFSELLSRHGVEHDLDSLLEEKWAEMERQASLAVDAILGSVDLIERLHLAGYALAVASASNLNYVRKVLETLGVVGYFSCVVSGDMVSRGKPDPEIFLLAASKINVSPEKCLVIEDGTSGMLAAKSANMKCVGLVEDKSRKYPAENLVMSLEEITDNYLKQTK